MPAKPETKVKKRRKKPIKRKPKGEFVCDWCYTDYKTRNKFGWNQIGRTKLCESCGKLYFDMIEKQKTTDEAVIIAIQKRIAECPGLVKEQQKLVREHEQKSSFSLMIIKRK